MTDNKQQLPKELRLTEEDQRIVIHANYELFVLFIAAFQVANSIVILALRGDLAQPIPVVINYAFSLFLIIDFLVRFWRTPNRARFLFRFHGYLTFIGSLPFPFAGLFRLVGFRLATVRLRRDDYKNMKRIVVRKDAQNAMLGIFMAAIIVLEISSIFILEIESQSSDANITSASDAVWWALVTMATVGYGDFYPVTNWGRLVALFVMVVGVGIFTILTSFFAQAFIRPRRETDVYSGKLSSSNDVQSNIDAIKELLDRQEAGHKASMAELRDRLAQLESQNSQ